MNEKSFAARPLNDKTLSSLWTDAELAFPMPYPKFEPASYKRRHVTLYASTLASYLRRRWHLIATTTLFILFIYIFITRPVSQLSSGNPPISKYAYAAFLAPDAHQTGMVDTVDLNHEDHYFVGTRMLAYQLLHDPITRTTNNIPFVVLVSAGVPQQVRDQLAKDGAAIVEVPPVQIDWIKPGRERWLHVMDKLGVFKLTQFEKVLLLDTDTVIVKSMDGVFEDPATELSYNLQMADKVHSDEGPQPIDYIMAGNSGPASENHPYPAPRGNRLNAGFVILKPSTEMFNHYMSVASIEGRFPGGSPEQDLWNYVHSQSGNMPWKQVDPDWTANTAIFNDYEHGIRSFHEKYWRCDRDKKLRDVLLRSRWKMEGFFDAREQLLAR
jgi:alpha-N-acetylglucosamine transferase